MLLMPLIPHLANECFEKIHKKFYWPSFNVKLLEDESCQIVIQIDGKKRGIIEMLTNSEDAVIIKKSKEIDNVDKYLKNKVIIKNIYIKNRLVNFITKK